MNNIYKDIINNIDRCITDSQKNHYLQQLDTCIKHHDSLSPNVMYLMTMLLKYRTYYPPKEDYSLANALENLNLIKDAQTNDSDKSFNLTHRGRKIAKQICPNYRKSSIIIILLSFCLIDVPLVVSLILAMILATVGYFYIIRIFPLGNALKGILAFLTMYFLLFITLLVMEYFDSPRAHFAKITKWLNNPNPVPVYQVILDFPDWHLLNKPDLKKLYESIDALLKYGLASSKDQN